LLRTKAVVDTKDAVDTYPEDPRPCTVETRDVRRKKVVDTRDVVLTYPADPRPVTLLCKLRVSCSEEINETEPRPVTVDASSTGSINVVI
jgi:hypothetical protein